MKRMFQVSALVAAAMLAACSDTPDESPAPAPAPAVVGEGFSTPAAARTMVINGVEQIVADRQVLVMMDEDVTPAQYEAVLAAAKGYKIERLGVREDLRMVQVMLQSNDEEAAVLSAIGKMPGVAFAGHNIMVETTRANPEVPETEAFVDLAAADTRRHALAISPAGRYWVNQVGLTGAWAVEDALGIATGPRIAVVDTGIAAGQTAIAESRLTRVDAAGAALTGDTTADTQKHGLWVSAFAAGASADAAGVSRFSSLLSVDVYSDQCTGVLARWGCPLGIGRAFFTDLAEGTRTAVNSSARIINVSWGREAECSASQADRLTSQQQLREMMKPLVNLARRSDKLMVFAAGNKCEKRDDQLLLSATDVAADSWLSNALIVGATMASQRDALFSRMGAVVNLSAPGDQVGWGQGAGNGTSYSAPMVAGGAAVVQGINSSLSAAETRYLLLNGAEATVGFSDMAAAAFRGYTGPNARGPNLLLNVGNSAAAARLTRDAVFKKLDTVSLAKGATREVSFDVEIPATGVRALDVVLLVDVSGSYGDDIATLKSRASGIVDSLSSRGLDVQFGVSAFADFPLGSYGRAGDFAYQRLTRMTADKAQVLAGINALSLKNGQDEAESQLEALYQVATGTGRDINGDGTFDAVRGEFEPQPIGWRTGAAKVVLFATDARFHDSDTETAYPGAGFNATVAALKAQGIQVIALQSGTTGTAAADIAKLIAATGGAAYQLSSDSAQVANAIAAGIDSALAEVEVTMEKVAGAQWIASLKQDKTKVRPGEKVRVTAQLVGQRNQSIDNLKYDLYLWARGNGSALLQRVHIPVEVPR